MPPKPSPSGNSSAAHIGFEAKLWLAADKLRNNMDTSEYEHVVLSATVSFAVSVHQPQ